MVVMFFSSIPEIIDKNLKTVQFVQSMDIVQGYNGTGRCPYYGELGMLSDCGCIYYI